MHLSNKKVVILWCAFAQHLHNDIAGKKRHWKSIGYLNPPNLKAPQDRQPVSVHGTDYCCCRGEALGGAQIPR